MQGYIINLNRVKEEDLIVTVLTRNSLHTLYRFYGARHGTINIGFKIDFEIEESSKSTIHRLRDVVHIGFPWINDYTLLKLWQDYVALFYKHLKDTEDIGEFYFDLINQASQDWGKQNPKRVAIESYIKILEHEGRLHTEKICFLCSEAIESNIAVIRAFLPTHEKCTKKSGITPSALEELFNNKSSLFLNDTEVNQLWTTLLDGL